MVDSIQQGQVNMHLLTDWAPLDVRQCGEQASNTSECHIVLSVTATVTIQPQGKTLRAANVMMVTFVRKLTVELRTPIKNTEKKNGIYTL